MLPSVVSTGLPGPPILGVIAVALVLAVPLHIAAWIEDPMAFRIRADLLIGAVSLPFFLWIALTLNTIAEGALQRLRPALDPAGTPLDEIAADLARTPNSFAIVAAVLGIVGGVTSVLQSPASWGVHLDQPSAILIAALVISVATDVLVLGLLAHTLHQLRVVTRVHRTSVRIDLFHLGPLYAFSTLTAWTGIGLIGLTVGLVAFLSAATGALLVIGASDLVLAAAIFAVAIACFIVPLLGLHGRIVDAKDAQTAEVQTTLATLVAEVRARVASGDLEGAGRVKDAMLAAESSLAAVARISTWPWRTGTLRGFASAVVLPIALFLVYETVRRSFPP